MSDALEELTRSRDKADTDLVEIVASARSTGATWKDIGEALGVIGRSAHRRFASGVVSDGKPKGPRKQKAKQGLRVTEPEPEPAPDDVLTAAVYWERSRRMDYQTNHCRFAQEMTDPDGAHQRCQSVVRTPSGVYFCQCCASWRHAGEEQSNGKAEEREGERVRDAGGEQPPQDEKRAAPARRGKRQPDRGVGKSAGGQSPARTGAGGRNGSRARSDKRAAGAARKTA